MARMPLPNQRRHARKAPASASTAAASTVLEVDGLQLHVTRKRIKNLYLRIKPPLGTVEVSAPMRMSQRQIIGFAHERHSWIVQQQRRMAEARRMSLRQAETLTPLPSAPAGDGGHAGVDGCRGGDQPQLPMFDRSAMWTDERKHAAAAAIDAALPGLLRKWAPIVGRSPSHVTLRVMTSRWGSCTPKTGRIRLNLQLGLMEPRFLEYVLVHEMTHLWANGHGADFQRRMSAYLPSWRELRRELNKRVLL